MELVITACHKISALRVNRLAALLTLTSKNIRVSKSIWMKLSKRRKNKVMWKPFHIDAGTCQILIPRASTNAHSNTPIQGSAADIIKIAMIKMQDKLQAAGLKATMLLQVHDELIFEAPKEEIPVLEKLVPSVMDSAVQLAVPLKVESHYGDTWYDAK